MKSKSLSRILALLCAAVMLLVLMPVTAAAEDTLPAPVVWFDFEDPYDFGKDKMGNHNLDCVLGNGFATAAVGAVGGGIHLDGDVVYAMTPNDDITAELKTNFTVSYYAIREVRIPDYRAWETPVAYGGMRIMHRIDSADADYIHIVYNDDDWWKCTQYPSYSLSANLNMYTMTVDTSAGYTVCTRYMNGELIGVDKFETVKDLYTNTVTFSVGSPCSGTDWYYFEAGHCFTGIVDEVRVWDSVLTQDQIASLFSSENPNGAKPSDVVFEIEIPDDTETEETEEDTEEVTGPSDDGDTTVTEKKSADTGKETKPAETKPADVGEDDGNGTLILIIAVAAVLVVIAIVLALIAAKKKKTK